MNYLEESPENRARGWENSSLTNAPTWVKTYLQEYRSAIVEKRAMNPGYLATFNHGCEVRSLMQTPESRAAATHSIIPTVVKGDAAVRARLAAVGKEIQMQLRADREKQSRYEADAVAVHELVNTMWEEEVAAMRAEVFPRGL
jgi:hypothetical protein